MSPFPEASGDRQRFDLEVVPPKRFITGLMQQPVMTTAERNGELVADLEAKGSRLCEAKVMWIAGLPTADKTSL